MASRGDEDDIELKEQVVPLLQDEGPKGNMASRGDEVDIEQGGASLRSQQLEVAWREYMLVEKMCVWVLVIQGWYAIFKGCFTFQWHKCFYFRLKEKYEII